MVLKGIAKLPVDTTLPCVVLMHKFEVIKGIILMLEINLKPFPVITTERLILRRIAPDDKEEIYKIRSNKILMQYIDRPLAVSMADAVALIDKINISFEKNEGITWAVSLKNDPKLIGTIGFWRIDKEHHRAEIGYLLQEAFQGKGIMKEAIKAALQYGFTKLRFHSVEANVNPANTASIKLLEQLQFIKEAHFKENFFYNGRFWDTLVYSVLTTL